MNGYTSKFQEGKQILSQAGQDQPALGMALIKIHSSLEDYLRVALKNHVAVPDEIKHTIVDVRIINWLQLANLSQEYGILTTQERKMALDANSLRQKVAHGETVTLSRSYMEGYARFVEGKIQQKGIYANTTNLDPNTEQPALTGTLRNGEADRQNTPRSSKKGNSLVPLGIFIVLVFLCGAFFLRPVSMRDRYANNSPAVLPVQGPSSEPTVTIEPTLTTAPAITPNPTQIAALNPTILIGVLGSSQAEVFQGPRDYQSFTVLPAGSEVFICNRSETRYLVAKKPCKDTRPFGWVLIDDFVNVYTPSEITTLTVTPSQ